MSGRDFERDARGASTERADALLAEEAARWYAMQREDALAPDEARGFMRWLQASPRHVAEYLAVAALAADLPAAARRDTASPEALLACAPPNAVALRGAESVAVPVLDAGPAAFVAARRRMREASPRRRAGGAFGVAAVLALVAVAGALWWQLGRPEVYHYATRHGEQGEWPLPDGSRLRLNSDSAVTLDFGRRHRRAELVRGQALFDVADQSARPFEVRVGPHLVKDIGTVFDVYRQSSGDTAVTVVEGEVRIWGGLAGAPAHGRAAQAPLTELGAGERAQVSASGALKWRGAVDPSKATAWAREEIVFENEPLAAVVEEFNRYNPVRIRIEGPVTGTLPVTGAFGVHDVETFTAFLDSLPELQATVGADTVVVQRR